jgi:hypothetical protein
MRRSFQKPFPKLIRRWIKDGGSIFKEYKITDFTRPIEFGTMTNKVATRNPIEIWLWKRLRAPSCYSAEQTLPGYTVFFKGRAQFIHDSCQRHSKTTWTRGGLQASVYPSTMWCWIMCWSAPDSRKVEWTNQPGTSVWGNASHIIRLLSSARMDYPAQYRWKISLPLISIIRLFPSTTSNTRFQLTPGGLLYLTNHHIHDYKLQALHQDFTGLQQLARRVFIDQGAVYIDQLHQQIQLDSHQRKGSEQWQKVRTVKVTTWETTAHQDGISKGIFQYCETCDYAAFTTQQLTSNYIWQKDIKRLQLPK